MKYEGLVAWDAHRGMIMQTYYAKKSDLNHTEKKRTLTLLFACDKDSVIGSCS